MWLAEIFATYLYALKFIAIAVAALVLLFGVDDVIIDVVYWVRRAWRAATVYRVHDRLDSRALYQPAEKPLAILIPAWQESGVIGRMAELAARTLDFENYHIFVGTYPNDPGTQQDVDEVCARFRNIHKVVCARPGPTNKADCLNNVLDAILLFEARAGVEFAGFVLHDAEDVISPLELRLFNYLVDRKDLIQLPVYPLERKWSDFTSAHYMDEFAELYGKDILVREVLAGQVPSAGVGTCFSRRAVTALLADGDGIAFDIQSLTDHYDIGFRLKAKGLTEVFVRLPVVKDAGMSRQAGKSFGTNAREASVICVREYFPNTVEAAVRQKARWIVGIVYQGFTTHRWTNSITLNYFLWRDRKGGITSVVRFVATLLLVQLAALWLYERLVPGSGQARSIFEGERWLGILLIANLAIVVNRLAQRVFFVSSYYGAFEGLLSIPRGSWSNVINFMANWRAIRLILHHGDPRRVAWDKTSHDFPDLGEQVRTRRPLGSILVARGMLSEQALNAALVRRSPGLRLGSWLVHEGLITTVDLAAAVAEQSGVAWETANTIAIEQRIIHQLPTELALHYAVLPLREEGGTLVLASEAYLDPVSTAALARKLKRSVSYVIVPKGQVTVGLRHWHARKQPDNSRGTLDIAVARNRVTAGRAETLWQEYVSRQVLFAELLTSLGHLDQGALSAVLLRHERTSLSLGEFMVAQHIISPAVLHEALELQRTLQCSISSLVDREISADQTTPGVLTGAVA